MKNKLFTLLLTLALSVGFFSQTQAQKNVLKINPLSLLLATGNLQYERALNESMSVQLGFFYTGFSRNDEILSFGYRGLGITPEFRYYVSNARKDAPRGVYLGPYVRYRNFDINTDDGFDEVNVSWNAIGGGLILGHQWLISDAFVIDLFIGPGINSSNFSGNVNEDDLIGLGSGVNVMFRWGISVGAAF